MQTGICKPSGFTGSGGVSGCAVVGCCVVIGCVVGCVVDCVIGCVADATVWYVSLNPLRRRPCIGPAKNTTLASLPVVVTGAGVLT